MTINEKWKMKNEKWKMINENENENEKIENDKWKKKKREINGKTSGKKQDKKIRKNIENIENM